MVNRVLTHQELAAQLAVYRAECDRLQAQCDRLYEELQQEREDHAQTRENFLKILGDTITFRI